MPDNQQYIIAIDLGTSGIKVALFSTEGELIESEVEDIQLSLLPRGGAEQSPTEWWLAINRSIKRLLAKNIVNAGDIVSVVSTGQWAGTIAVNKDGQALSNAIIWIDARGSSHISPIVNGPLKIQGYGILKLIYWIRLTGGIPAHSGKDPIAHILYLKHVHPEIYRQTYKFLEPIDYLGLCLTGKIAASYDSITLHWLTDTRDIRRVSYHPKLIELSTIDPAKLPELMPANSILGNLRSSVAKEWGVRENVQVVIGSPDVLSAAVGSGAVRDYETHLYIGTSSWLTCHVPFKKTDILHNLASVPSAIPGRFLLANEQECAGACLQYLRDRIFFPKDALPTGKKPQNVYPLFDQMAEQTPAGSGNLIFTPWLNGERTPVDDLATRSSFYNQSLQTTREQLVRAVFEGVAYNTRWLLQYVEQFIHRKAQVIHMVGGGARSNIWCQIQADILNRPIRQMKNPVEVNARGAALLASAALGYLQYDEIGTHVPIANTYLPNPDHRAIYDELFNEFITIYESNRKVYARLNKFENQNH
jgi:xylulokinase